MAAAVALALLLPVLLQASHALATAAGNAHPGYTGADAGTCGPARHGPGLEEYGGGRIVDITHAYRPVMPGATVQPLLRLKESMEEGSDYNLSDLRMECHTGTHVDAPGHMNQAHFAAGLDVDTLDLDVLNGPALLVDVPRHTNITAEAMESLNIPKGVRRVLFRTLSTERGLMWKEGTDWSYVGFTEDGAQWLVDNTDIKLVGIDYISVASFDHLISAHVAFFRNADIILVESLKLDNVNTGLYMVHCLPLRLVGAEGSPIRCILIK
ncbi:cyclase-like protein 1 isoform X1 [Lolium perenne]|uniref:cyclase-like protein 1 isoform X1 n=1 Tax=Lolium perenne TaxID=4522 RepID=UPI0021F522E5|nr:cyclase-like protein 1 isoform X1 [Lolium perenne]